MRRNALIIAALMALSLGAAFLFDWHVEATLLFCFGAAVAAQACVQRFAKWHVAAAIGGAICAASVLTWAFTDDTIGELRRLNQQANEVKQQLLDEAK
jgi:hypothetical protein